MSRSGPFALTSVVVLNGHIMSSVYFPVQVVVILRRLVNIISTISISSHYLASSQRRNEHRENGPQSSKQTASVLSSLKSLEPSNTTWPWYMGKDGWKWPQTYLNGTISAGAVPDMFLSFSYVWQQIRNGESFGVLCRRTLWTSIGIMNGPSKLNQKGEMK